MKKKIMLSFLALTFVVSLLFLPAMIDRYSKCFYGINNAGNMVFFDNVASKILFEQDAEMSKNGFQVEQKQINSDNQSGSSALLPYDGINMQIQKVVSVYTKPLHVISHKPTLYQQFLNFLEKNIGKLSSVFYLFDCTKYTGNVVYEQTVSTITNIFIIIETPSTNSDRVSSITYASSCKRTDDTITKYINPSEFGDKITSVNSQNTYAAPHFDGDLTWLKSMAYTNFVSRYNIDSSFESYTIK